MFTARIACPLGLVLFFAWGCSSAQAKPSKAPDELKQAFSAATTVRLEVRHNATPEGPLRAAAAQVLKGLGYKVQGPQAAAAEATVVLDIWCDLVGDVFGSLFSGSVAAALWQDLEVHGKIAVQMGRQRRWEREFSAGCLDASEMVAGDLAGLAGEAYRAQHGAYGTPDAELAKAMPKSTARAVWGPGAFADNLMITLANLVGVDRTASLLQSPQPELRCAAARGLGELGHEGGVAPLRAALPAEQDPEVKRALAEALGKLGDRSALEALAREAPLSRGTPPLRPAAGRVAKAPEQGAAMPDRQSESALSEPADKTAFDAPSEQQLPKETELPQQSPVGQGATVAAGQPIPQDAKEKETGAELPARQEGPQDLGQPTLFSGDYKGIYSGAEVGELVARVENDGRFNAIVRSRTAGTFTASGSVQATGQLAAQATGGLWTITFEGKLQREGNAVVGSGAWRSSSGFRGKWRVERAVLDADSAEQLRQVAATALEGRVSATPTSPRVDTGGPGVRGLGMESVAQGPGPVPSQPLRGPTIAFVTDRDTPPDAPRHVRFSGGKTEMLWEGAWEVYLMRADGTQQTRLTKTPASAHSPASSDGFPISWSPDGRTIAFVSCRDTDRSCPEEIYVMERDGSGQRRLTDNNHPERPPAWSPDGRTLAFARWMSGNWDIWRINVDGTGETRLTSSPGHDLTPHWSPDGNRIAFNSDRDGNWDVYVMDPDGANQTNLTKAPGGDDLWSSSCWSPDGGRVLFTSDRDGDDDIYVLDLKLSTVTELTNAPAQDCLPSWSPDGSQIAFASKRRNPAADVFVMSADGSGQRMLAPDGANAVWSPDGRKIAFTAQTLLGNWDIYVVDAEGTNLRQVTDSPANENHPRWQPLAVGSLDSAM